VKINWVIFCCGVGSEGLILRNFLQAEIVREIHVLRLELVTLSGFLLQMDMLHEVSLVLGLFVRRVLSVSFFFKFIWILEYIL